MGTVSEVPHEFPGVASQAEETPKLRRSFRRLPISYSWGHLEPEGY
jgi:hypothetical protein